MTSVPPRAGAGDCERCRPGLISQPVNTVSSLGYVAAGIALLCDEVDRRPVETLVAWSAIAAGVGSVAFHGPGDRASKVVHDAGLLALLTASTLADLERLADVHLDWPVLALVPAASAAAARSRWSEPAQLVVGVAAVAAETVRLRRRHGPARLEDRVMLPVVTIGATAHVLGGTGGPLCAPDSLLQPHAFWHLATATAVWLRGRSLRR